MTAKPPEEHAGNWDLRHEDFNDNDFLYDVYAVMRRNSPFAHTDEPFLVATPGGAWVATRYAECYKILQDWEHFSSNPSPEGGRKAHRRPRNHPRSAAAAEVSEDPEPVLLAGTNESTTATDPSRNRPTIGRIHRTRLRRPCTGRVAPARHRLLQVPARHAHRRCPVVYRVDRYWAQRRLRGGSDGRMGRAVPTPPRCGISAYHRATQR